ncbi:MAG: sensor histidine kinase [Planctomycetota bacterium]
MSLRWKLVALYMFIVAAIVAGFSAALLVGVRRSLLRALDAELESRARAVCALAEFEGGQWFVEPESGLDAEFAAASGRYYQLCDASGQAVLVSELAQQLGADVPPTDGARDIAFGGRRYRELAAELEKQFDAEDGVAPQRVRVVCGKATNDVDTALYYLVWQLAIVAPIVLLISFAGGWFLVARALRPIEQIARTADEINANDLSRRIAVTGSDEISRLAGTLNAMFGRLEESFARQTRFTADASHELRTPLAIVAGNVELALKQPRSVEEYRETMEDIREAADRMRAVVEGLLTLARADANTLPLQLERCSLKSMADEIVRLLTPLAEVQRVAIAVEPGEDVHLRADPNRLRELISNLVTNAIRYNRAGGRVVVRVRGAAAAAELAVEDTGIGIPPADLPHIFERFYRADKARTREHGGTGLGLAISKWIVEAHAGTIAVTSELGVGTRFVVTLPRSV